jgi:hypothetical protein
MEGQQQPGDRILHQNAVEDVVDDQLERASDEGVMADVAAAVAAPTQAEFNALQESHNKVLGVLRDAGLIPTA